jgi:glycosyltransferase involved in cell wall biosynthesis
MDISVVICTYNRAILLDQALEALSSQEVDNSLTWEVIVVDNNSNDNTQEVVNRWSHDAEFDFQGLFENRQGKTFAINKGIENARGRIVAFTDDDVTPDRKWLANIVRSLDKHRADGVGGRILPKWSGQPPGWLIQSRPLHHRLAMLTSLQEAAVQLNQEVSIFGANMAFRRAIFDEVGLFDVRLGPRGNRLFRNDEMELVGRALSSGKKIVYDPSLVVWHYVGPERMQKRYFRKWSFDVGEGEALIEEAESASASSHSLRSIYWDAAKWLKGLLRNDPQAFTRETDLWGHAGYLWGRLRQGRIG